MQTAGKLPAPKSKITKILHALLQGKFISEQQFKMNSFRSILSDLRNDYKIPIRSVWVEEQDEFGKPVVFKKHYLLGISRKRAYRTYLKINN